jgi:integrase
MGETTVYPRGDLPSKPQTPALRRTFRPVYVLEFRHQVDHDYLLTGLGGQRLDKNGMVCVFRGIAKRAGVERRGVSPHTRRHTFASLLLQEGADLVSIQELFGHADLLPRFEGVGNGGRNPRHKDSPPSPANSSSRR